MKLVAISVGRPREVEWRGRSVRTSIFKTPVSGRVRVTRLNIEGDEQSDLSVHGGRYKSVYVYPSEHYAYWRKKLPDADLPWGVFGENLTTDGMLETDVCIGDRFRIGSAEFQVTQPRQPCFKLGIRFGRDDMLKRFVASGRSGFYLAVVQEGELGRGDDIHVTHRESCSMSVADIFALKMGTRAATDMLQRAAAIKTLTPSWREHFLSRVR